MRAFVYSFTYSHLDWERMHNTGSKCIMDTHTLNKCQQMSNLAATLRQARHKSSHLSKLEANVLSVLGERRRSEAGFLYAAASGATVSCKARRCWTAGV